VSAETESAAIIFGYVWICNGAKIEASSLVNQGRDWSGAAVGTRVELGVKCDLGCRE
jgi:hypothetical protein